MSLLVCSGCSTRYAPGSPACPHCGSTEQVEQGSGSRLPFLEVACVNADCPAAGVKRRIQLRYPVPGLVEMPNELRCTRCWHGVWTAALSAPMEENMPKITRHGGASNAAAEQPPTSEEAAPAVVDEGVASSPGSSSETSSRKPPTSSEPSDPALPKRARTTGSRSGKGRAGSSTAGSTAGSGEADAS